MFIFLSVINILLVIYFTLQAGQRISDQANFFYAINKRPTDVEKDRLEL